MTLGQQIKESDAQFVEAYNRGDFDAMETLHEDNAMLLSPDSPATVVAAKQYWKGIECSGRGAGGI